MKTLTLPQGWSTDQLSEFIQLATENSYGFYQAHRDIFDQLVEIDECFATVLDTKYSEKTVQAFLTARCHSSYRAAVRLTISGQAAESFAVLRLALENALYALHMDGDGEREEIWAKRHDDEQSLAKCRKEFTFKKLNKSLQNSRISRTRATAVSTLYERCIDFGAHPNERSVTASMKMEINRTDKIYGQLYLVPDGLELQHIAKTTLQVGVGGLLVVREIFRERFDILSITEKIDRLSEQL